MSQVVVVAAPIQDPLSFLVLDQANHPGIFCHRLSAVLMTHQRNVEEAGVKVWELFATQKNLNRLDLKYILQ